MKESIVVKIKPFPDQKPDKVQYYIVWFEDDLRDVGEDKFDICYWTGKDWMGGVYNLTDVAVPCAWAELPDSLADDDDGTWNLPRHQMKEDTHR